MGGPDGLRRVARFRLVFLPAGEPSEMMNRDP